MTTIRAASIVIASFALSGSAGAVTRTDLPPEEMAAMDRELDPRPQLQLDLGLSVICAGYEQPLFRRLALFVGGGVFGSYFLPWFDLGDRVIGGVGDVRLTWFLTNTDGRGIYLTPYTRAGYAAGGPVITAGVFAGAAFRLSNRLDLRVGVGGQYIYIDGDDGVGASTPFVALDLALGFRL